MAQGVALGGYLGASIELKTSAPRRLPNHLRSWLVLVETLAAGTEGTRIERNLTKNVLWSSWNKPL